MTVDEAFEVCRRLSGLGTHATLPTAYEQEQAIKCFAVACDSQRREIEELRAALQAVRDAYGKDSTDSLLDAIREHVLPLTKGNMTVDEAIAWINGTHPSRGVLVQSVGDSEAMYAEAAVCLLEAYQSARAVIDSQHNEITELTRELATLTELNNALNRDLGLIRAGRGT